MFNGDMYFKKNVLVKSTQFIKQFKKNCRLPSIFSYKFAIIAVNIT